MASDKHDNMADDAKAGKVLDRAVDSAASMGACPRLEDIALLIDGGLGGAERESLLSHLASCGRCREVYRTAAAIGTDEKRPEAAHVHGWRFGWLTPYAVAAGIVLIAVSTFVVYRGYYGPGKIHRYGGEPQVSYTVARMEKQEAPEEESTRSADESRTEASRDGKADRDRAVVGGMDYRLDEAGRRIMDAKEKDAAPADSLQFDRDAGTEGFAPPEPSAPAPAPMAPAKAVPDANEAMRNYGQSPMSKSAPEPMIEEQVSIPHATRAPESELRDSGTARETQTLRGVTMETKPVTEAMPTVVQTDNMPQWKTPGGETVMDDKGAAAPAVSVKVVGILLAISDARDEIVLRPNGTREEVVMKVDPDDVKVYKTGDEVMVQYDSGKVNYVRRIKKARTITVPVGC